jgi:hypothetical protein
MKDRAIKSETDTRRSVRETTPHFTPMTHQPTIVLEEEEKVEHHHLHQKKKSHIPRQPSREVIETIVLDPFGPVGGGVAPSPQLPKPDRIRMISFEDSQELSKKLGGFMLARMRSKDKDIGQGTTLSRSDSSTSAHEGLTRQQQPQQPPRPVDDIKHCLVDLDMAHERWPACLGGSSTFSLSSNSSTSWSALAASSSNDVLLSQAHSSIGKERSVTILPYPTQWNEFVVGDNYDGHSRELARMNKTMVNVHDLSTPRRSNSSTTGSTTTNSTTSSSTNNNNNNKQRSGRSINRNDVVRTRQWGKRICIPSHLLRPPLIRRQSSTE